MPSQRRPARAKPSPKRPASLARALLYKVVELSAVDEHAIERALNEWVPRGWAFDGVQFAMRESSKRPAMAFVFFTREGGPLDERALPARFREDAEAEKHLKRIVLGDEAVEPAAKGGAWERLAQLADDDGEDE